MSWRDPGPVVVVAPHPDDEILGPGGALRSLVRSGHDVSLLYVTDGEGSHPGSSALSPAELGARRRCEAARARRQLGLGGCRVRYLSIPDGAVSAHEDHVRAAIVDSSHPSGTILAPWRYDGHPDHDACGRAAAAAADLSGATVIEYPVWMWNWAVPGDRRVPWDRARSTELSAAAVGAKAEAVSAFATQIEPIGETEGDRAILPERILAHHRRRFEIVFV